jgi:hypothetical protein
MFNKISLKSASIGVLLMAGLSAPAIAGIAEDLKIMSVQQAYAKAKANCRGSSSCEAQIARDLLSNGVTAVDIMIAAVASGADPAYVVKVFSKAAINAGVSVDRIASALLRITKINNSGINEAQVVQGLTEAARESQVSFATVVSASKNAGASSTSIVEGLTAAGVENVAEVAQSGGISVSEVAQAITTIEETAAGEQEQAQDTPASQATETAVEVIEAIIESGGNSAV